ncbi:hypothetical protein FA15DRAFT_667217 [Coprinopsis marcescibilis]|uniref:Uncharacterized protein n=1 Tax=Coprinopsis marcescibilis TaxID=230819 RepID=A0A5C3L1Q7_COPMA|nr:hypothetical protein FA15DRAFT_667217 [Coprinopsis marcescibilis]
MISRRVTPYLVAAATGVISGYYIFKPLIEQGTQKLPRVPSTPVNVPTTTEESKKAVDEKAE